MLYKRYIQLTAFLYTLCTLLTVTNTYYDYLSTLS